MTEVQSSPLNTTNIENTFHHNNINNNKDTVSEDKSMSVLVDAESISNGLNETKINSIMRMNGEDVISLSKRSEENSLAVQEGSIALGHPRQPPPPTPNNHNKHNNSFHSGASSMTPTSPSNNTVEGVREGSFHNNHNKNSSFASAVSAASSIEEPTNTTTATELVLTALEESTTRRKSSTASKSKRRSVFDTIMGKE